MTDRHFYHTDISPPAQAHHLPRLELIEQLQNTPKKLTLIQAPPGYGKTALLSQIWQRYAGNALWVNLREVDNDPVNLIHKLNAALLARQPGTEPDSRHQQLGGMAPPSFAPWIRTLSDTLNREQAFAVFLNDVDYLSNPESLGLIEQMIQQTRPWVRFYVSATQSISFSYSALLVENQVASITQTALRFDRQDVQQYFLQVRNLTLPPKLLQQLVSQSEGWPAALSFAVNTLSSETDVERYLAELSTMNSAFDRYFIERIFEKQTPALQKLLLRLSLLDRFSLELSQLICDTPADHPQFADYVRNHTFITPIDSEGKWFRFHALFNQFLHARSLELLTEPERQQTLSQAAHWFAQKNLVEDAISLMIAAGAPEEAAHWMEEAFPHLIVTLGKHVTYANWYQALGEQAIEKYPRARIGFIWSLTARRQYLQVANEIARLHSHAQQYDTPTYNEIKRVTSLIHCAMKGLQDDALNGRSQVEDWLARWNAPEYYFNQVDYHYEMGLALVLKGFFAKCLSQFSEARQSLTESISHFKVYGTCYGQTWAHSLLAVTYAKQGFHHEAQQEAQEGYRLAKAHLGENSHSGYGLAALLGAIHYEHDDIELATHYLTGCLDSLKEQSATDLLCAAYETQTRLFMQKQAYEEGLGFLKDGIKWAEAQRLTRLTYKLVDELIVWLFRLKRDYEAEIYASQYALILPSFSHYNPQAAHRIAARALVYQFWQRNDFDNAGLLLSELIQSSQVAGQQRKTALYLSLQAIQQAHNHCEDEALTSLQQALQRAAPQSYFRLFLDEPRLHPLILHLFEKTKHSQSGLAWYPFFKRLVEKTSVLHPSTTTSPKNHMVEPLTTKETEIIQLLESGLANKKIAEKLFISEGTLKWHLHNIYAKLQVKNRTQALVEGRKQGYLSR